MVTAATAAFEAIEEARRRVLRRVRTRGGFAAPVKAMEQFADALLDETREILGVDGAAMDHDSDTSGWKPAGGPLDQMSVAELRKAASGLGIKGYAQMRKAELIERIREAGNGGSDEDLHEDAPVEEESGQDLLGELD